MLDYTDIFAGDTIDSIDWRCPDCGGPMDFWGSPREEYDEHGMFVRTETVACRNDACLSSFTARQVYAPKSLTVKRKGGGA